METRPHIQNGNTNRLGDLIFLINLEDSILTWIYELPSVESHHDQPILAQLWLDYPTTIGLRNCSFRWSFDITAPLSWSHLSSTLCRSPFIYFQTGSKSSTQQEFNSAYMLSAARHHHKIKYKTPQTMCSQH